MKKIALFIMISAFLLAGCTAELTPEEIKAKLIEANTAMTTYTMDMTMDMDMAIDADGTKSQVKTGMDISGKVDRTNKKMSMVGTMITDATGEPMEMEYATYLIDDTMYTSTMGMWMKMEFSNDLWSQQDQIDQMIELINSGTVEQLEGKDEEYTAFYVIKVNPDLQKVVEMTLEQQQQMDLDFETMDIADMIRSYSFTVWVNRETFIIQRSSSDMDMVMTPENMGALEEDAEGEITIKTKTDVTMTGYDVPVEITLPAEAAGAIDMATMMGGQSS